MSLKDCCAKSAGKDLKKHRDVAVCDGCGQLLLAYGNDEDYEKTKDELAATGIEFQFGQCGSLRVISKARAG